MGLENLDSYLNVENLKLRKLQVSDSKPEGPPNMPVKVAYRILRFQKICPDYCTDIGIALILSGHGILHQNFRYGLLYLMAAYPVFSTHCEAEDLLHHQD